METTQTGVRWLIDQIKEHKKKFGIPPTEKGYMNLIEQAKEIEKDQIAEAYRIGVEEDVYINPLRTGDEYYNETYNK